jgi:hypothetical protein
MDFTKKDARSAAETATFCHLRDQDTGEYINDADGSAVGVMVIGAMARSVQNALRDDARAKLEGAKGKSKQEAAQALADIQDDMIKSASKLTASFVGVDRGDKPATLDDCAWFYDLNMFSVQSVLNPKSGEWQGLSFAQQVLAHSNDAGNYLGNS